MFLRSIVYCGFSPSSVLPSLGHTINVSWHFSLKEIYKRKTRRDVFSREEVHPVDVLEVWKDGVLGDELVYVGKHVSVEKKNKNSFPCQKIFLNFAHGGGPRSVMVTLLTLKEQVRGSNPGAAPPKFGAQTPPGCKDASRVPPPSPERGHVGMAQAECRAPGMTKKNNFAHLNTTALPAAEKCRPSLNMRGWF